MVARRGARPALAPPSWTIEQVPTALKHIYAHRPWTKAARTDIVHGWDGRHVRKGSVAITQPRVKIQLQ